MGGVPRRARQVSASGVTPISVGGADGWTLTDWFENVYLRTAGPDMYRPAGRPRDPLDRPQRDQGDGDARRGVGRPDADLRWHQHRAAERLHRVRRPGLLPDDAAAIVYEGDFVAGVITENTTFKPGEHADFFPFPSIEGSEAGRRRRR